MQEELQKGGNKEDDNYFYENVVITLTWLRCPCYYYQNNLCWEYNPGFCSGTCWNPCSHTHTQTHWEEEKVCFGSEVWGGTWFPAVAEAPQSSIIYFRTCGTRPHLRMVSISPKWTEGWNFIWGADENIVPNKLVCGCFLSWPACAPRKFQKRLFVSVRYVFFSFFQLFFLWIVLHFCGC